MKKNDKPFSVYAIVGIVLFFVFAVYFCFTPSSKAADEDAQAKIGDTYYETLAYAFANVQEGETVTLNKDVTLAEGDYLTFDRKIAITFDLNGHTLSGNVLLQNVNKVDIVGIIVVRYVGSKVTFVDSTGGGKISNTGSQGVAIHEGGEAVFLSGTYAGKHSAVYCTTDSSDTYSKVTVYDGIFQGTQWHGLEVDDKGTLEIYGGTFTGQGSSALKLVSAVTKIYGGTFKGASLYGCDVLSGSTLEVYGGTFIGKTDEPAINLSTDGIITVTVYEGTFSSNEFIASHIAEGSVLTYDETTKYYNVSQRTIEFITNGGTINSGEFETLNTGEETVLPTDVTKEGYYFIGWFDNPNLTGSYFTKVPEGTTESKVYYAKWSETEPILQNGIMISLGKSVWAADESYYFTFPECYVGFDGSDTTADNNIKFLQLSYSGNDTTNAKIVYTETENFSASKSNTELAVSFQLGAAGVTSEDVSNFIKNTKFYCNASQTVSAVVSKDNLSDGFMYCPETGHFYQWVSAGSSSIQWLTAYRAALSKTFGGWSGYLANITSEVEDNFIKNYVVESDQNCWLGGTRMELNNIGTTSATIKKYNGNYGCCNYWYWASGPESKFVPNDSNWSSRGPVTKAESDNGTYENVSNSTYSVFLNKSKSDETDLTTYKIHYPYTNWQEKEPNACTISGDSYESCMMRYGENGQWCDEFNTSKKNKYYIVEYGDRLYGNSTLLDSSCIATATVNAEYSASGYITFGTPKMNDENPLNTKMYYNSYSFPELTVIGENNINSLKGGYFTIELSDVNDGGFMKLGEELSTGFSVSSSDRTSRSSSEDDPNLSGAILFEKVNISSNATLDTLGQELKKYRFYKHGYDISDQTISIKIFGVTDKSTLASIIGNVTVGHVNPNKINLYVEDERHVDDISLTSQLKQSASVQIPSDGVFTANISTTTYHDGYTDTGSGYLEFSDTLPANTKITLCDFCNGGFYYYILEGESTKIYLENFKFMATTENENCYERNKGNYIRGNIQVVVDFSDVDKQSLIQASDTAKKLEIYLDEGIGGTFDVTFKGPSVQSTGTMEYTSTEGSLSVNAVSGDSSKHVYLFLTLLDKYGHMLSLNSNNTLSSSELCRGTFLIDLGNATEENQTFTISNIKKITDLPSYSYNYRFQLFVTNTLPDNNYINNYHPPLTDLVATLDTYSPSVSPSTS